MEMVGRGEATAWEVQTYNLLKGALQNLEGSSIDLSLMRDSESTAGVRSENRMGTVQHTPDNACFQHTELHSSSGETGSEGTGCRQTTFQGRILGLAEINSKSSFIAA